MIRPVVSFLTVVLALLLCFQTMLAQEQTASTTDKQKPEAALREKAFKLLESLADQLSSLQSAENRARMGSNIAESLWTHDETKARSLFKLVEEDIKLGLKTPAIDSESDQTVEVFLKLRADNVERIGKHDPEMALAFLKETFPSAAEAVNPHNDELPEGFLANEHAIELRLAKQIGLKNPNVTLQLARQSLEHGLSADLVPLVIRLNGKNKEEGQGLYKDIVQKIAESDFNEESGAVPLAQQLVARFTPPEADVSTYKELVDVFLKKAFAAKCDQPNPEQTEEGYSVCNSIGIVLPVMEKYSPAQVRKLSRWAPTTQSPELYWINSEIADVIENGTIDEVMQLAVKYPAIEMRIYWRAVAVAQESGDTERAKKILNSYHGDPENRRALENQLQPAGISEEQFEQQVAIVLKNSESMSPQGLAGMLLLLVEQTAANNPKAVVKALGRIEAMVNTIKPGEEQTHLQIQLAATYCSAKLDHGFEIMEPMLPQLNDLVSAAVKLDGYDTHYLRDGEWNMSAGGSIGNVLTILAGNAGYFAWQDFDRAVTLAGQFERMEIRMMAQLKLAQEILAGPAKSRFRTRSYGYIID